MPSNIFDTVVFSWRVSDGVKLNFTPCVDEPQMFCFVCEYQVPGMKWQHLLMTLQQSRVCAISPF